MEGCSGELAVRQRDEPGAPTSAPIPIPIPAVAAPHQPADMFVIQVSREPNGSVRRSTVLALSPDSSTDRSLVPVSGDLTSYLPPPMGTEMIIAHPIDRRATARWSLLRTSIIAGLLSAMLLGIPLVHRELTERTTIADNQAKAAEQWHEQSERDSQSLDSARHQLGAVKKENQFLLSELQSADDKTEQTKTQLNFHEQAIAISNQPDPAKAIETTKTLLAAMEAAHFNERVEIVRALGHRELMAGHYPIAQLCYRCAIEWGGDSLLVRTDALQGLALAYEKQDHFDAARDAYQDLVDIDRRRSDVSTAALTHLAQLALMGLRVKDNDESTEQAVRTIDRLLTNLDGRSEQSSPEWRARLIALADATLSHHLDGVAARLLERIDDQGEAGAADPMLVNLYIGVGRFDDARRILLRSLPKDFLDPTFAVADPKVADSAVQIAQIDERRGDLKSAELMLKTALRIRERALGEDHPEVADAMYSLSRVYERLGRHSEADALRISANEIWAKHRD